jgi:hypothetical protein
MIITTAKITIKLARSKTARKVARKAYRLAKEHVELDAAPRSVSVGQRTFSLDRSAPAVNLFDESFDPGPFR